MCVLRGIQAFPIDSQGFRSPEILMIRHLFPYAISLISGYFMKCYKFGFCFPNGFEGCSRTSEKILQWISKAFRSTGAHMILQLFSDVGVKGGTLVPNELSGTDPVVMRKMRKKVAGAVAGQRERGGPAEGNSYHPRLEW